MGFRRAAWCCLLGLAVFCTPDVEPLTPAQREAVAAYVSKAPPSPDHVLDLNFGGRLELLGYDLEQSAWRRGQTMRVTWYWHSVAPTGEGWKLFTHVEDPASGRVLNQDGNGTIRWLYGPEHWRAGQFIRDVQELHLPDDWEAEHASLYVGAWRGDDRMSVVGGEKDGDDRALAVTVPVRGARPEAPGRVPRLAVVQTKRPPRLDGSLRDPEWAYANATPKLVETRTGGAAAFEATAKLLWDARYLYVGVDVKDGLLRASDTKRDSRLWEQDCVELMVDPDGDGRRYFEIQVSPRGVVFDTRYDSRREPKPFGHVDWDSRARVGVSATGGLDDRIADAGYTVEIAIPWQAFSLESDRSVRAAVGDQWRANLYVMDLTGDGQRAAAWSAPGTGDFHVPARFGILTFEGPPEDMLGTTEPSMIPPERMPASLRRERALDPKVKGNLLRDRDARRRLESPGDGH